MKENQLITLTIKISGNVNNRKDREEPNLLYVY